MGATWSKTPVKRGYKAHLMKNIVTQYEGARHTKKRLYFLEAAALGRFTNFQAKTIVGLVRVWIKVMITLRI